MGGMGGWEPTSGPCEAIGGLNPASQSMLRYVRKELCPLAQNSPKLIKSPLSIYTHLFFMYFSIFYVWKRKNYYRVKKYHQLEITIIIHRQEQVSPEPPRIGWVWIWKWAIAQETPLWTTRVVIKLLRGKHTAHLSNKMKYTLGTSFKKKIKYCKNFLPRKLAICI